MADPFYSRKILLASVQILKALGHSGFDRLLLEFGLPDDEVGRGSGLMARANSLASFALQNPNQRTADGDNLWNAIVERAQAEDRGRHDLIRLENVQPQERQAFKDAMSDYLKSRSPINTPDFVPEAATARLSETADTNSVTEPVLKKAKRADMSKPDSEVHRVFISHATADRALAKLLVNFLKEAIGVRDNDIFCSSIAGHGVPLTVDFNDYMRDRIQQPKLVLLLITPAYLDSHFCLMELGAAWAKSLKTLAIVVPPVSYDMVTKTLGLRQSWKIVDHSRLSEFRGLFSDLELEVRSPATWEDKTQEWRRKLSRVMKSLPGHSHVSAETLEEARAEIETARAEAQRLSGSVAYLEGVTASQAVALAASKEQAKELERLRETKATLIDENERLKSRIQNIEARRPRVMIIEGEPKTALHLEKILLSNKYDVVAIARTRQEAVEAAMIHEPEYMIAETVLADGSSGIDAVNDIYEKIDSTAIFATSYPERLLSGKRPEPAFLVTKPYEDKLVLEMLLQARRNNEELAAHNGRIFEAKSQA